MNAQELELLNAEQAEVIAQAQDLSNRQLARINELESQKAEAIAAINHIDESLEIWIQNEQRICDMHSEEHRGGKSARLETIRSYENLRERTQNVLALEAEQKNARNVLAEIEAEIGTFRKCSDRPDIFGDRYAFMYSSGPDAVNDLHCAFNEIGSKEQLEAAGRVLIWKRNTAGGAS